MIVNPQSWQPGGAGYANLSELYGSAAADKAAGLAAADNGEAFNLYLSDLRRGTVGVTYDTRGTLSVLYDQMTTDPLGAPLEGANAVLKNSLVSLVKAPMVLLLIAVIVAWQLGLFNKLRAK